MEHDEAVDRSGAGVVGAVSGPVCEEDVPPFAERSSVAGYSGNGHDGVVAISFSTTARHSWSSVWR